MLTSPLAQILDHGLLKICQRSSPSSTMLQRRLFSSFPALRHENPLVSRCTEQDGRNDTDACITVRFLGSSEARSTANYASEGRYRKARYSER